MAKPVLYVAVKADYTQYKRDIERIKGIARQNGESISNALNNAISPGRAINGLTNLTASLSKVNRAISAANAKPMITGLAELAQKAGVSTAAMDRLSQAMLKTSRQNALERGFKTIQKESGYSAMQMAKLRLELGDTAGAIKAFGSAVTSSKLRVGTDIKSSMMSATRAVIGLIGAYKALDSTVSFVKRGLDFNSSIESSQIAIASVIAATNNISTVDGKRLQGVEKLNAAQEISKDMMEEIQVLALKSTATFDSLADGVAAIVAPATKAGISLERLPKFAVTAAQAMTTMKIPIQQMRTEIESLLSGNINKVQDILATNLGITGKMVKNWQAQGTLIEELEKRLEVFAVAGARVADSWAGLRGNMEDALNYISGKAGRGLFEAAKESYRELLGLLVSTEGKVGVGKDFENILNLIKEIEDAIGDKLVGVTRNFIDKLKELNRPENLGAFKQKLEDIWGVATTVFDDISKVGRLIVNILGDIFQGWQGLPEPIREYGLILALLGGKKIKIALAALALSEKYIGSAVNAATKTQFNGIGSFGELLDNFENEMQKREPAKGPNISLASSHKSNVTSQKYSDFRKNFVGPQVPKGSYLVSNAIGGFDGEDAGASKIANAREQLQKLKEEIAALNGEATKGSNSLAQKEREIARVGKAAGLSSTEIAVMREDYAQAFNNKALKELNKELLQLEGNTRALRDLERTEKVSAFSARLAEVKSLSREEKDLLLGRYTVAAAKQESYKDLQTGVRFLEEMASLGGEYGLAVEQQNLLLAKQADLYRDTLPESLQPYIDEWERLQRLQKSRSGWDGLERGARKFGAEYGDMAAQVEGFTTQMGTTISDTLADAFMKGKLSAADFFNSLIGYAAQAASNALIGQIFSGIGGLFGGSGAFGGDAFSGAASATTGWVAGFATGGVAEPSGLPRSGGVLNSPTFFNDGMSRAYARGGLSVAGEAGPEVFMPAMRMSDGNYGVRVDMSAVSAQLRAGLSGTAAPNISINVINQTGGQVDAETQARPDGNGGFTLDVLLTQVEQGLVSRAKNGRSSLMQYQEKTYGLSRANVLARGRGRA